MNFDHFSFPCGDLQVIGQLLLLDRSCYIWLGMPGAVPLMDELSVAVTVPASQSPFPASSVILDEGEGDSNLGQSIARNVAKKFKIQCFVSYNLADKYDEHQTIILSEIFNQVRDRVTH